MTDQRKQEPQEPNTRPLRLGDERQYTYAIYPTFVQTVIMDDPGDPFFTNERHRAAVLVEEVISCIEGITGVRFTVAQQQSLARELELSAKFELIEGPVDESAAVDTCACCGDAFGSGEFAPSRCDSSLCHWCYTNGEDDE
jgi:hypothetical protein